MGWKLCYSVICTMLFQGIEGCWNLALHKPATVSFLADPSTGPEHAVDGENVTAMDVPNNIFCSFVETHSVSGWWEVDLQINVRVGSVRITTATYAYGRPKDFLLEVYPDPRCDLGPRTCHQHVGTLPGAESTTIYCSIPLRGRSVRLTQVAPFFLCEFEVYQAQPEEESSLAFRDLTVIKYPGEKRTMTTFVQTDAESVFECGRECLQQNTCPYFNYWKQTKGGVCQIPSCFNGSDVITSIADWDFYETYSCQP